MSPTLLAPKRLLPVRLATERDERALICLREESPAPLPPLHLTAPYRSLRLVSEHQGRINGTAAYIGLDPHTPRHYGLEVYVAPTARAQGIGRALYDSLLALLRPLKPERLETLMLEGDRVSERFFRSRDYCPCGRSYSLSIVPSAATPAPLPSGMDIVSLKALQEAQPLGGDGLYRALYALLALCLPGAPRSFESFLARYLYHPQLALERIFVARQGEQLMGVCILAAEGEGLYLHTLAVHPQARRRGLATALVSRALGYASRGAYCVLYRHAGEGSPLDLYKKLGFRALPQYLHLALSLEAKFTETPTLPAASVSSAFHPVPTSGADARKDYL